ncbi:hypothetical protein [Gordonia sp. FQ]|uniref:hypothetical protein n=1 Tax=Gordonia sp. FQ TaxID=3446634 RepID=UPI003F845EF7
MEERAGNTSRLLFPWFLILVALVCAATIAGPGKVLGIVIALSAGAVVAAIQAARERGARTGDGDERG